jgi:hypothetical protein
MIIDVNNPKLKKSHLMPLSKEPLVGLLTLETDQGQSLVEIDEDSANGLLDEVLALFGVPRPPAAEMRTSAGL